MPVETRSQSQKRLQALCRDVIAKDEYWPESAVISNENIHFYYSECFEPNFQHWPRCFELKPKVVTLDFELVIAMLQLRKLIPMSTFDKTCSKYDLVFYCRATHPTKPKTTFSLVFEDVVFPNHQSDFDCTVKALSERGKTLIDSVYSLEIFKTHHSGYKLTKISSVEIRIPAVLLD